MRIKMKIGPQAGRIVEVIYDRAKALVEAGHAEDVYDQMRLPKPTTERADAVFVEGSEPVVGVDLAAKVEPIPITLKSKVSKGRK